MNYCLEKEKEICNAMISMIHDNMDDIHQFNTQELGMIFDMIKDSAMTIYYLDLAKDVESKWGNGEPHEPTPINDVAAQKGLK